MYVYIYIYIQRERDRERETEREPWKQPKCPLTDEQVKEMWYMYIMEYDGILLNHKQKQ